VTISENYNVQKKEYRLTLKQRCPNTPGQTKKAPFHIPFKASLLLDKGSKVSQKERAYFAQEVLLELTQAEQSWVVKNIPAKPVLSINRNFSAPIILEQSKVRMSF
jgi:aminopeptidase N